MKTQHKIKSLFFAVVLLFGLGACTKDLETIPLDKNVVTSATFYDDPASYEQVLAKLYGGLSLTGQVGPNGDQDVLGIDEGASNYVRAYWYMQDMSTEMALWIWNDPGLPEIQTNTWTTSNEVNLGMYSRIFYQITLANELIRETADGKLSGRGISGTQAEEIKLYRAEARFLRAMSYYHALDLYRSVPFVTEEDEVGAFLPPQIDSEGLFEYVESELLELEELLAEPKANVYGRIDRTAAWMILAKLYLNAEVYIGEKHYTEAVTYAKKAIESGYTLDANYDELFMADNHTAEGIILPVVADGLNAQSWGGMTMLACSSWAADMDPAAYGINAWGGNRARKNLIDKFEDYTGATDKRAMFYTTERTMTTDEISEFKNGFSVMKYKNITSDGTLGSNDQHMDIDFPLLRVADAYLMFAEAVLRGGQGGSRAEALGFVNDVRTRAYGDASGNIADSQLTLDFILDERAREFYWEGYRRTDLVRYGYYTSGDFLWEWKGGVYEGKALPAHFEHFPIPASDISANPNLEQVGY